MLLHPPVSDSSARVASDALPSRIFFEVSYTNGDQDWHVPQPAGSHRRPSQRPQPGRVSARQRRAAALALQNQRSNLLQPGHSLILRQHSQSHSVTHSLTPQLSHSALHTHLPCPRSTATVSPPCAMAPIRALPPLQCPIRSPPAHLISTSTPTRVLSHALRRAPLRVQSRGMRKPYRPVPTCHAIPTPPYLQVQSPTPPELTG